MRTAGCARTYERHVPVYPVSRLTAGRRCVQEGPEQRGEVGEVAGAALVQRIRRIPLGAQLATTSLASRSLPSWNLTPWRSLKVHSVRSALAVYFSASAGSTAVPPIL